MSEGNGGNGGTRIPPGLDPRNRGSLSAEQTVALFRAAVDSLGGSDFMTVRENLSAEAMADVVNAAIADDAHYMLFVVDPKGTPKTPVEFHSSIQAFETVVTMLEHHVMLMREDPGRWSGTPPSED